MAVDMDLINNIHSLDVEMGQEKSVLRELRSDHKADIEATDEFKALQQIENDLKQAKLRLERAILNDADLGSQREALKNQTEKIKDLKDILSSHLVEYFKGSGRQTIQIGDLQGDEAREVILSAKLGIVTDVPENERLPL